MQVIRVLDAPGLLPLSYSPMACSLFLWKDTYNIRVHRLRSHRP